MRNFLIYFFRKSQLIPIVRSIFFFVIVCCVTIYTQPVYI